MLEVKAVKKQRVWIGMSDKEKIEKYILDFAAYDIEPLHIIISALIEEQLCSNVKDIAQIIVELTKKGYLLSYSQSGISEDKYIEIKEIDENEIISNIENRKDFSTYPNGKEYFFKTSEKGKGLITNI